jgi:hypothetical protein
MLRSSWQPNGTLEGPSNFTVNVPGKWLVTMMAFGEVGISHEQKHGRTNVLIAMGLDPKLLLADTFTT